MTTRYPLFLITLLIICTSACKKQEAATQTEAEGDLITITKTQFNAEQMVLGSAERMSFMEHIKVNGRVEAEANAHATISCPIRSTILRIFCQEGDAVSEGQLLIELGGSEMLDIQKDYAESSAALKQLEADYSRAKNLFEQMVGSEREFIQAESSLQAERARNAALKLKIRQLNLDAAQIAAGNIFPAYTIKSPVRGKVVQLIATRGQTLDPGTTLLQIMDPFRTYLRLDVFPSDISKLQPGQEIRFHPNGMPDLKGNARLSKIGAALNEMSRTVSCIASYDRNQAIPLVINQFIQGEILVQADSALALPGNALMKSGNDWFVLVLEKEDDDGYHFRRHKVSPGREDEGFTEISGLEATGPVLIRGNQNISLE